MGSNEFMADRYSGRPQQQGDPLKLMQAGREIIYAPSQEMILKKGLELKDVELRALYFILYQSAARISEMLPLKFGDVQIKSEERHRYAEVRLLTLKNRKKGVRFIAIPLYIPIEVQMYSYFDQIYQHRINEVFKETGNTNRITVWNKLNRKISFSCEVLDLETKKMATKEIRLHPHLLRHFRLSHMVTLYNFDALLLTEFAGWTDSRQAMTYVSLSGRNIAQQFAKFRYTRAKPVMETPAMQSGAQEEA